MQAQFSQAQSHNYTVVFISFVQSKKTPWAQKSCTAKQNWSTVKNTDIRSRPSNIVQVIMPSNELTQGWSEMKVIQNMKIPNSSKQTTLIIFS